MKTNYEDMNDRELFIEALKRLDRIIDLMDKVNSQTSAQVGFIDLADLSSFLHVTRKTIERYVRQGRLRVSKPVGKLFFSIDDVRSMLLEGMQRR